MPTGDIDSITLALHLCLNPLHDAKLIVNVTLKQPSWI